MKKSAIYKSEALPILGMILDVSRGQQLATMQDGDILAGLSVHLANPLPNKKKH